MARVSRPLIGLLVATVAFFALWLAALRPSSNGSGGAAGVGQHLQSAIDAAHGAVALSNKVAASQTSADAATTAAAAPSTPATTTPASSPPASSAPASHAPAAASAPGSAAPAVRSGHAHASATHPRRASTAPARPRITAAQRVEAVAAAMQAHRVLALLFYNPAAPDDRAVARELRAIPTRGGRVFRLAVPIAELSAYGALTNQVPVTTSPTLVLVDRHRSASTIVGYASAFEIAQRVSDALAVRR